eukprot:snap_masked-scaffold_47-processed-gene-0.7-mRNA-1 protein AED:1.00 eAED:1.00 QI:0/-1/0/0/-1/1/1/0/68
MYGISHLKDTCGDEESDFPWEKSKQLKKIEAGYWVPIEQQKVNKTNVILFSSTTMNLDGCLDFVILCP